MSTKSKTIEVTSESTKKLTERELLSLCYGYLRAQESLDPNYGDRNPLLQILEGYLYGKVLK